MIWKCQIVTQNTTMAMVHMMGKTFVTRYIYVEKRLPDDCIYDCLMNVNSDIYLRDNMNFALNNSTEFKFIFFCPLI